MLERGSLLEEVVLGEAACVEACAAARDVSAVAGE